MEVAAPSWLRSMGAKALFPAHGLHPPAWGSALLTLQQEVPFLAAALQQHKPTCRPEPGPW